MRHNLFLVGSLISLEVYEYLIKLILCVIYFKRKYPIEKVGGEHFNIYKTHLVLHPALDYSRPSVSQDLHKAQFISAFGGQFFVLSVDLGGNHIKSFICI